MEHVPYPVAMLGIAAIDLLRAALDEPDRPLLSDPERNAVGRERENTIGAVDILRRKPAGEAVSAVNVTFSFAASRYPSSARNTGPEKRACFTKLFGWPVTVACGSASSMARSNSNALLNAAFCSASSLQTLEIQHFEGDLGI